jgi:Zn-dependent peptidase ImmA (M78 family)
MVRLANLYRHSLDSLVTGEAKRQAGAVPKFSGRTAPQDLSEPDQEELVSFRDFLRTVDPPQRRERFKPRQFETIQALVHRWVAHIGMRDSLPVPILEMIRACGIVVRFTALNDLAGALIPGDSDHADGILINSDQPYARQRHTAAHELGHFLLGHESREVSCQLGRRFDSAEVHADQFAGELLVPVDPLMKKVADLKAEPLENQILRLATAFLVSFQAMTTRLSKLGAISPSDADRLGKLKVGPIERAVHGGAKRAVVKFKPTTLANLVRQVETSSNSSIGVEGVRRLQELAFYEYVSSVSELDRAESAGDVYGKVALWVADEYPIVRA